MSKYLKTPAGAAIPYYQGINQPAAYSVDAFCEAHHISRNKLYQLWAAGIGPVSFRAGTKRLISHESAARWRQEREAAAIAAE
jgi:hypothetical protein